MKRFQNFAEEAHLSLEQVLPVGENEGMDKMVIKLFLMWAKKKYKPNTI